MTLNNRIKLMEENQNIIIAEMKESQKNQKQVEYIKNELDGLLWADMMEHNNIFDDEIRSIIIDDCMSTTDVLLYNKDYTYQYLCKRYYTLARQIEQIKKKTATNNDIDYKQRIAIDKWNLQRQKELLKIEKLKQDINKNNIKYNIRQPQQRTATRTIYKASGSGGEVAKVLIFLMFAPVAIFGLIIYGFISAAAKTK